jgi:uncharacterized protein
MKHLLPIILLSFLLSCSNNNQVQKASEVEIISKYENGKTKMERIYSTPSNFIQRQYYDDGTIEVEAKFVDFMEEGKFVWKYKNGKPKWIETYSAGKQIDTTYCYYETGELKRKVLPSKSPIKAAIEYYETGEIKIETYLNNSTSIDSTWTAYFKNGKVKEKGLVQQGVKAGFWKFFNPASGKLDSIDQNGKPKVVFDFEEEELKYKKE